MESIEYQEKGENIFEQYLGKVDQKRNKSDFVVLILLGVMVMIVAMPTGQNKARKKHRRRNKRSSS